MEKEYQAEKAYSIIGLGTAGLAQRVSSLEESSMDLYILKPNKLMSCGQNQF
jgi:hypothetical protein